jgi:hypothetical protein
MEVTGVTKSCARQLRRKHHKQAQQRQRRLLPAKQKHDEAQAQPQQLNPKQLEARLSLQGLKAFWVTHLQYEKHCWAHEAIKEWNNTKDI